MQICLILCKMAEKFKSPKDIQALAEAIKHSREARGYTLVKIEKKLFINRGQLSRFESGDFKTLSPNLQKLCKFLKITSSENTSYDGTLGARIERFAKLSKKHRDAAEKLLLALERLC